MVVLRAEVGNSQEALFYSLPDSDAFCSERLGINSHTPPAVCNVHTLASFLHRGLLRAILLAGIVW